MELGALVLLHYGIDPVGLLCRSCFRDRRQSRRAEISAVGDAAFEGLGSMEPRAHVPAVMWPPAVGALLADLGWFVTILMIPVQLNSRDGDLPRDRPSRSSSCTDMVLTARCWFSYVHFVQLSRAGAAADQQWGGSCGGPCPAITGRGPGASP